MKTYKNPISKAMAEYREDFRYNREWWTERMGTGNNNEYLWVQFKNGDCITVQADYFQLDGNTCLPRFRASDVEYISRYFGDGVETTTAANIVVDTNRIILFADGAEFFRMEMTEEQFKEMRAAVNAASGYEEDGTKTMLDYCMSLAQQTIEAEKSAAIESAKNVAESTNTNNTPATMNEVKQITVTITEDGNKCEYTTENGQVLAKIEYLKEFDKYDVNTPAVGFLAEDITEAREACESGVNWLLEQKGAKANYRFI